MEKSLKANLASQQICMKLRRYLTANPAGSGVSSCLGTVLGKENVLVALYGHLSPKNTDSEGGLISGGRDLTLVGQG